MKLLFILLSTVLCCVTGNAQQIKTIPIPGNLVIDGIPTLPYSIVEEVKPYTDARAAGIVTWHPVEKQMLITTRFGNAAQLHRVKMPGGDRKQITFFNEPVGNASFEPAKGNYFLFTKDVGGNEFAQIYRYDVATATNTLLTDGGKTQNGNITWNKKGTKIIYTSTRRNGTDRDIYLMDPLQPSSDKRIIELQGGGWSINDWSEDEKYVLLTNGVSINESSVWIYDVAGNKLTKFLPEENERAIFSGIKFSKNKKSVFIFTNNGSEFAQPVQADISTKKISYITKGINWGIDNYQITKDGKTAAFTTNEAGISKLYIQDLLTKKYNPVTAIPVGVINNIKWHNDNKSLAITFITAASSADVYEWNVAAKKLTRWTESELGGMNLSGIESPALIKWKSFDGLEISGFLYKASKKFTGKRPVIINIHGGPEGQSLPQFIGSGNYYLNELGVCIIYPNVRGSTGYGKTFTDLDNGIKREESVKDIGALLDWIEQQPGLDASRIMITGGSYGGYMTLACAVHYNDKIRCAVDIVGISNFNTFLKNTESYRRDLRRVEYGDERDTAMASFFERIAPLNNTQKITKPLFIIQGKNDPRVPYTEAEQMVDRIKKNGKTVWYLMANDEGHGFRKKNNQDFQLYSTVAFVKEYLLK
ncbi:MAG: S9 family peptidase [Chitinophagaceae bacterium]|nr:S9 family peptidase [Chitinophagaceae bacterium]